MPELALHSPVPAPGDLLAGKYRVLRVIGEGGMGLVLEAEHALSGKRVAIKWLQPSYATEPNAGERLLREARAAARVRHPNVVDVYDVLEDCGSVMLVMELLDGETLGAALERGEMSIARFLRLVIGAMRGVAAAHKQNVIHRDIKPENIFLANHPDRDLPVPKVLDFGISKVVDGSVVDLTRTGDALGTPLYMSYEQLNGARDLDQRADVYAFGVLLYEGLSGYPPFVADTFSELIVKIATSDPVPLATLRPELPADLVNAVHRALERDREQRTPSLDILAAELERLAAESPSGPRAVFAGPALRSHMKRAESGVIVQPPAPEGPPVNVTTIPKHGDQHGRNRILLAGVAVLLCVAIAAVYALSSREAPPASDARTAASAGVTPALAVPERAPTAVPAPPASTLEPTMKQTAPLAPSAGASGTDEENTAGAAHARKHGAPAHKANASPATATATAPIKSAAPSKGPRLRAGRLEREEF